MKRMKRLLALLLALALALILALPAFAEPDPAMPVITVQPQNATIIEVLFYVKETTIRVNAHVCI